MLKTADRRPDFAGLPARRPIAPPVAEARDVVDGLMDRTIIEMLKKATDVPCPRVNSSAESESYGALKRRENAIFSNRMRIFPQNSALDPQKSQQDARACWHKRCG